MTTPTAPAPPSRQQIFFDTIAATLPARIAAGAMRYGFRTATQNAVIECAGDANAWWITVASNRGVIVTMVHVQQAEEATLAAVLELARQLEST